ncbi:MAG: SH3 domain-containing protein, partial [Planctomycetota bacterium]|nr:SH3 domain-containing protein [Planctomycetota bacterium]
EKGDTVMGTLNKGDKVVIVGEKEQWFKIKPPEGMYLWVAAKFVKLEQTGEREPENSKPQPTVTEPTEREKALEKELAEIRKQYEELDARLRKKESELNEIRREREERERRVADLERKLKEAEESREETEKRLREAKEIAERMAAESGKRELKYTAVGTVSDFGPYVEGPEGTKYKLLETGDGPVKYYLKPSRSEIRLDDYLSKQVGIIGTVKKVTGWDVPILIVERIEILSK